MKSMNKDGFTLVELMVVAVIVAILAAVAIPLMSANKTRAMATEAEAALGTVKSAFRAMYAETDAYNEDLNGGAIAAGAAATALPGISAGDLDGTYFSDESYVITAVAAESFTVTATGDDSTAPKAGKIAGVVVTIDEAGTLTRTGL